MNETEFIQTWINRQLRILADGAAAGDTPSQIHMASCQIFKSTLRQRWASSGAPESGTMA